MAVRFFRITEKGSIKKPTIAAIIAMVGAWSISIFLLRDHPFIFMFIAWPVEYVVCAILFSNPFRVTISKAMHITREATIVAIPAKSDRLWLAANMPTFEKTGIKLYRGESLGGSRER